MSTTLREPVSKVDTAWWHMESPVNHMVVTSVLLFDRPLRRERVRALFEERMLRFPRFRQRIVTSLRGLNEPQWELDPDFDIDAHIHHLALPAPGDEQALRDLVGDIASLPLDPSAPLWASWIVDGVNGRGSALISRIHHCIADGIALTRLLLSLTDEDPTDRSGQTEWWEATPQRTRGEPEHRGLVRGAAHVAGMAARESLQSVRHPQHAADLAGEALGDARALARVTFLPAEAETSLRRPLGTHKAVAWTEEIPLAGVKRIAHSVGGTVNDVLVAAVTGGLRTYLLERGEVVPEGLELHATVPVNLRPLDGPIALGNRFGLIYPTLPVGVPDTMDRLRAVKKAIDDIKATPEAVVAITVLDALGHTPKAVEELFIQFFTSKSSMVLTNVPGPRHRRRFAGVPLRRVVSWAPPSGSLPMSVSIFSYAGQVTIAVLGDTRCVPDAEGLVRAIEHEVAELRRAGLAQRRAASR
ncbi:MAG TPA: wax ester/triacylglycerol synthase family O-acyltransferase [Candidatus Dormibacteraeota bacterium]|nr:wax ester/triacylglycerol synthase family O-acyltransferase [Candidatus Dormibacteraeota bacterium]